MIKGVILQVAAITIIGIMVIAVVVVRMVKSHTANVDTHDSSSIVISQPLTDIRRNSQIEKFIGGYTEALKNKDVSGIAGHRSKLMEFVTNNPSDAINSSISELYGILPAPIGRHDSEYLVASFFYNENGSLLKIIKVINENNDKFEPGLLDDLSKNFNSIPEMKDKYLNFKEAITSK